MTNRVRFVPVSNARPKLVAIVGGSGAGKTWLADKLQKALRGKAARLSLDNFYRDRSHLPPAQRAKLNFDHPSAIDWPALERVLRDLVAGKTARVPCYDFKTHTRLGRSKLRAPKPIILVDGLWLLRRALVRRLFALSIFVDCPRGTRLRRRLARDLLERGRTRASVLKQFRDTVEPMHRKYISSQARRADLILSGNCPQREFRLLASRLRGTAG